MRYKNAHIGGMLPMGAFEHCGDRKIKLYGAVDAVTSFVGDAVGGALDVVSGAIDTVVSHPLETALTVAAIATANPELLALDTATAAGTEAGLASLPSSVATAGEAFGAGAGTAATDAALAAGASGTGALGATDYLGSTALGDASTGAVGTSTPSIGIDPNATLSGINTPTTATINSSALNTDNILNSALKGAGKGALTGGISSAIQGGNPLQGAIMGGLTGGVGGAAGNTAYQLTGSNIAGGITGGVAGGGTSALLGGRDPLTGALIGGLSGGTTAGINELTGTNLGSVVSPLTGGLIANAINGTPSDSSTNLSDLTSGNTSNLLNTGTNMLSGSTSASSSGLPKPLTGQALTNTGANYSTADIIKQLKQLNPALLSKIAPNLASSEQNTALMQSGLSSINPPSQAQGSGSGSPYSSLIQTMLAGNGGQNPNVGLPLKNGGIAHFGKGGYNNDMPSITVTGSRLPQSEPIDPLSYKAIQALIDNLEKQRKQESSQNLANLGLKMLSPQGGLSGGYSKGGDVEDEHIPEFITGATGHYVKGRGDGQSDDIPAMLADGEYVFDADTVAQLGNGSSDAGAKLLDHFREALREHKRSASADKIPPKAAPLTYMKEALKRHERG